jgi:hypothetical protein
MTREHIESTREAKGEGGRIKVLFISEQLAVPEEVVPYLAELLEDKHGIDLYIKFRPYRDGFEMWLEEHRPELLSRIGTERIFRGDMKTAITTCDFVVGTHSTAVLEGLLYDRPFACFETKKWGDCFDLDNYHTEYTFYAKTPHELMESVRKSQSIPTDVLLTLQDRFFGDPYMNGSTWVVDQMVEDLKK